MLRSPSLLRLFAVSKSKDAAKEPKGKTVEEMLHHEYRHNPYFTSAFPEISGTLETESVKRPPDNWVESLLQRYNPPRLDEPHQTSNHLKHFVEGYRSPRGPIKWMSEEEKAKVHDLIDHKMTQLEETGLSREEILFNRPGGTPLSFDPVFQLVKSNREVREMLVKQGEEFTVESVIDPALNQDFGIDRSKILPNKDEKYTHELPSTYDDSVISKLRADDRVKSEDYYWRSNLMGKIRALELYGKASDVLFPRPLESRKERRNKRIRSVNHKDISFKNPALLSKFMSSYSKIRNRWCTKLDDLSQRKIAHAIKHTKNLAIFPFISYIRPFHNKTLSGAHFLSSNIYIHCDTGIVFAKAEIEKLNENNRPEESTFMRLLVEKYKKNMSEEDLAANYQRQKAAKNFQFRTAEMLNSAELDILEALNHPTKDPDKATPDGKFTHEAIKKIVNSLTLQPSELDKGERAAPGNVQQLLSELNQEKEKLGLRPCPESAVKAPSVPPMPSEPSPDSSEDFSS